MKAKNPMIIARFIGVIAFIKAIFEMPVIVNMKPNGKMNVYNVAPQNMCDVPSQSHGVNHVRK